METLSFIYYDSFGRYLLRTCRARWAHWQFPPSSDCQILLVCNHNSQSGLVFVLHRETFKARHQGSLFMSKFLVLLQSGFLASNNWLKRGGSHYALDAHLCVSFSWKAGPSSWVYVQPVQGPTGRSTPCSAALTALQFLIFLKEEAPHFPFAPPLPNYVAGGMKGKVFGDADSRSLLPGEHSAP